MTQQQAQAPLYDGRGASDDLKQNLESRVASAAARVAADNTVKAAVEKATAVLPTGAANEETPNLPMSSVGLTPGAGNTTPGANNQ
jgi:hypothetical protein